MLAQAMDGIKGRRELTHDSLARKHSIECSRPPGVGFIGLTAFRTTVHNPSKHNSSRFEPHFGRQATHDGLSVDYSSA